MASLVHKRQKKIAQNKYGMLPFYGRSMEKRWKGATHLSQDYLANEDTNDVIAWTSPPKVKDFTNYRSHLKEQPPRGYQDVSMKFLLYGER